MPETGREVLERIVRRRADAYEESLKRSRDNPKSRLREAAASKIRTTMIGSISAVEDVLGALWGQGKSRDALTEAEREMDGLRQELRYRILDLGNGLIRSLDRAFDGYEIDQI